MVYPDTFVGFVVEDPKQWHKFKRVEFTPKKFEEYDVDIKVEACGVCGSDLHCAADGWSLGMPFPLCPGHEIIGKVIRVGEKVKTLKVGDRAGVGAQMGSCMSCEQCKTDNENYCPRWIRTVLSFLTAITFGGYASHMRAHEYFTFPIPDELETIYAAPMLCAGLTVFHPLKRAHIGSGMKVGVVGIGGLGHLAVQWIKALGADAYALSHSPHKKDDALKLGAKEFIVTTDPKWTDKYALHFDMIINTVDQVLDNMGTYMSTLKVHGKFWNVGLPDEKLPGLDAFVFAKNSPMLCGSHIGSRVECLEMFELAAKQGIKTWVETIPISEKGCEEALTRLKKNDVKFRFVLTGYDKAFPQ